jgi:spore coat polysaccharide biosynthesis protein SpsF (cytidylyltransferase family)
MVKNKKTKKKISAIVQARMTSTRLPGKVLMDIEGKPMLWHIINRLRFSKKLNDIILAIPDTKKNDILEKFAKDNKIKYFRGNENDVLSRYYETAKKFKCEVIIRITGDDPLVDPQIIDFTVKKHLKSDTDYTSNNLKRTFPLGLDIEVFNFEVLERAYKEAKENYQREHVTAYIYEHPEIFKLQNVDAKGKLRKPSLRLTVDTKEDLKLIREIYRRLYKEGKIFLMEDILALLKLHPELVEINKDVKQKEI